MESRQFDKCPCCGSTVRFFESLAKEAKDNGQGRDPWSLCYKITDGVAAQESVVQNAPGGSKFTTYKVLTDICYDCGCVYAKVLLVNEATKQYTNKLTLPGNMPINNPRLS